jgi:BirA family biotin operon repressor/biotin-[acetyl-CoA-carboxylase] ligase
MTPSSPAGPLPADVKRHLTTSYLGARFYFYPETDSTNEVALALAAAGEPEGTVVAADYQRSGRGRRGRVWSSPPGKDLLFSALLRPGGDARDGLPVTLVVATAVAVVLAKQVEADVRVKWPNDVVVPAGKMAGILAESVSSGGALAHLVVGVGVNVNSQREDFAPGLGAASCRTVSGVEWDRAALLSDLLGAIEAYYDRFKRDGFGALSSAYEARLWQAGRTVAFEREGRRRWGRVTGVARDGALVVRSDEGHDVRLYSEAVEVVE